MAYKELREQFAFYLAHQEELLKEYAGKAIVLKDNKVVGEYESEWDAVEQAQKEYKPGTFLVQLVTPGTSAYTVHIASNQVFSGV